MDRFESHGARGERPLYERLLALPGQAILTVAALPVLAPVLIVRGVRRWTAAAKSRGESRAPATASANAAEPVTRHPARGNAFAHA